MLDTYELDVTTDLHAYGLSIRTAAQLDLPLLDHEDAGVTFEPDERTMYRAPACPIFVSDDPSADLPGYAPDRTDPTLLAEELEADEDAMLTWLQRCAVSDEDNAAFILDPEANMTEGQKAMRAEARAEWRTRQLSMRKMQLHRLLQDWFGVTDYRTHSITTWVGDTSKPKGVRPVEVNVLAWIANRIEEKGGDELAGIASCAALMRRREASRRARAT